MDKDDEAQLLHFCKALPKVELHAHLNTSYSKEALEELILLNGNSCNENIADLAIDSNQDIDESFKLFFKIQRLVQTEEAVYTLTCRVIKEFAEDNVKYLELRSTPKDIPDVGMTRELYLRTMVRAVRDCATQGLDIEVRLLPSIDRRHGVKVAEITVDLAEKLMKETNGLVIGIDLSGDPKVGDASDFIPVFLDAHSRGLKLALHLAELPLYEETKNVLRACAGKSNMRIGHGTFLHRYEKNSGHDEMEELVIKAKIPIEVCITSNLKTLTVASIQETHFKYWLDKGHPVVLCTDGKGVYGSLLSQEYYLAAMAFSLTKERLKQYVLSTLDCVFDDKARLTLKEKFNAALSGI